MEIIQLLAIISSGIFHCYCIVEDLNVVFHIV